MKNLSDNLALALVATFLYSLFSLLVCLTFAVLVGFITRGIA